MWVCCGKHCDTYSLSCGGACGLVCRSFGKPLLLLGGGGYTIRNVARCWTYETSVALDATVDDELPYNDYYEYVPRLCSIHTSRRACIVTLLYA